MIYLIRTAPSMVDGTNKKIQGDGIMVDGTKKKIQRAVYISGRSLLGGISGPNLVP
jgi:hypothetical protein